MTDTAVFYIHGFGSSVNSTTLQMLREYYPDAVGLTYDVAKPATSLLDVCHEIRRIADGCEHVVIVGSSLGGWYAEQLTNSVVADFVMYNPATEPEITLAKYGVPQDVLYRYKVLSTQPMKPASRTVILCTDDETIDPKKTEIKYKDTSNFIYTSGGHRMTLWNMELIVDQIQFLENQLI